MILLLSIGLLSIGSKTELMLSELKKGVLEGYTEIDSSFLHEGISYQVITRSTRNFSKECTACVGSLPTAREVILLNPADSPLLEKRYIQFLESGKISLEGLVDFIRSEVFDPTLSTKEHVAEVRQGDLALPLERFLAAKRGVCRHFALVTAYFLDRLSQEKRIPPGESSYVRGVIDENNAYQGHAWNLYLLEDGSGLWHIDTTLNWYYFLQ